MTHANRLFQLLFLASLSSLSGCSDDAREEKANGPRTAGSGLEVAFLGDQGLGTPAENALLLVKNEKPDLLVILGDFDYQDDPAAWIGMLDSVLGPDFPWIAVVGNHDVDAWSGYQPIIASQIAELDGATCTGDLGAQMNCDFRGLHLVLTGVGTLGTGHEDYMADRLAESTSPWKVCGWHKNQREMQIGDKTDEVGWEAYRTCMQGGAIITTGHEHSYARTRTLTDLGNSAAQHGVTGETGSVHVAPGKTFVVVSGLGGASFRAYEETLHDTETWWASMYASDWTMKDGVGQSVANLLTPSGAFFVTFGVDGNPNQARAVFKTAGLEPATIDEFDIFLDGPLR